MKELQEAAARRGISIAAMAVAARYEDRKQSMAALRSLGLSCAEIGAYYGITRQRVDQIVDSHVYKTRPVVRGDKSPEEVAREIWEEAAQESVWWGDSGRLVKKRMVEKFRSYNYTYPVSREYAGRYSISKLEVILITVYGVEPNFEAVKVWLQEQAITKSQSEILDFINSTQRLSVPWFTFATTWRDLSLPVARRRTREQIEAGVPKFSA